MAYWTRTRVPDRSRESTVLLPAEAMRPPKPRDDVVGRRTSMRLFIPWTLVPIFSILITTVGSLEVVAQQADASDSTAILLDEPVKEPPPAVVRQNKSTNTYSDGTLRVEQHLAFLSDDRVVNHGPYVEYYHDGQKYAEGVYQFGVYAGEWKYWHPNGQLCKAVSFKAGRPNGEWEVFRPDGSRQAKKGYQNGLRQGKWLQYFKQGEKLMVEVNYDHGKIDGDRVTYFESGQVRQQVPYKEGVIHGTLTNWDESGQKLSEITFEKGKVVGRITRFDIDANTPK